LAQLGPDATIVFGTGKLKAPVLSVQPERMFNLHGGDPQEYRGLDTHLWAIYHGDFSGLVTTLHRVAPALDDGDIVASAAVPLHRSMGLHELRAANTEVCLALTLAALTQLAEDGHVLSRRQSRAGRYYSFMPAILKDLVCAKFASHTGLLPLNASRCIT
jgi:methionyl-tRNA formyltransferase